VTSRPGDEVRALYGRERNAMLCTLSKKIDGWPFGSLTPYAVAATGEPIILISEIAEHTRNLREDARASLLVQDSQAADDPQAGARVTLMGYAIPVPPAFVEDARRRYLDLFPGSASYFEIHDFTLFQIKINRVRFIGGFGEIHWLDGGEVTTPADSKSDPLAPHAEMICNHMNEDHQEALRLYATAFAQTEADAAQMIHVDSQGFDMVAINAARHKALRIAFSRAVTTTDEVRAEMVEMVRRARQVVAGK
jgi:putative heme iron utilization protein